MSARACKIAVAVVAAVAILAVLAFAAFSLVTNMGKGGLLGGGAASSGSEKVVTYDGVRYRQKGDVASICVMGSDMDNGTDHGEGLNGQADAIMVVAVDTASGKATGLSIPRNTMVDIDLQHADNFFGTDRMQICLAYALGATNEESCKLVCTAVSRLLYNIPMNHYYGLDISCVDELADAVSGVPVTALEDVPYTDVKEGDDAVLFGTQGGEVISFDTEDVQWEGGMAAWYVRFRDMDDLNSPLQRQARGQQFARAFVNRVLEASLSDPSVPLALFDIASASSTTDLDASEFAYLASLFVGGDGSSIEFRTLEGQMVYNDESEWGQFVPDKDALYRTVLDIYFEPVG